MIPQAVADVKVLGKQKSPAPACARLAPNAPLCYDTSTNRHACSTHRRCETGGVHGILLLWRELRAL